LIRLVHRLRMIFTRILNTVELSFNQSSKTSSLHHKFGSSKLPCSTTCSGRLTWDVFVCNLTRQLGTPSHWLPVDSCKEGQKGALAAVCTSTLKSASKKHQNSTPPYRSTVNGTLKVVKRKLCTVCLFSLWQTTTL